MIGDRGTADGRQGHAGHEVRCRKGAELLGGELGGGDSGLGEQSRCGGLVGGHREGVAAVDARAVAPCSPGQVYGAGAVHAHGAAVPPYPGAPAGPRLVEKALHATFGICFSPVGSAGRSDLYEFVTWGRECGVGAVTVRTAVRLARRADREVATADPTAEPHASSLEALVDIGDALARLPLAQRVVLILRTREALSEHEIAATLGISAGTVKSRLHRARAAFREVWDS
jgi:RNA polymerase sigma factor (sigma-70 family)